MDTTPQAFNQRIFLSTPSARRATSRFWILCSSIQFLSTPSARRATLFSSTSTQMGRISIHALREEGDPVHPACPWSHYDFYPRPPRGGRRSLDGLTVTGV